MELKYEWWEYFLIPWIAGFVGYATNVIALKMTFYPYTFWGVELWRPKDSPIGLFGWQGIIPTKTEKMASISIDLMLGKLFNLKEIFGRLDPEEFSRVMEDSLLLLMDSIIEEVANEYMPTAWQNLPKEVRDDIVVTADKECFAFLADFMTDMKEHIEDVVDIKDMGIKLCVENRHVLVKLFQECGEKEFVFIERSGFWFGFMFGVFQMTIWFFYDGAWILPVAGFLVGWFTNFVALKVIFTPVEPKHICGYHVQGLFLKRQHEVAAIFARVMVCEIVHVKAMWDAIFGGPLKSNFYAMLRAHTLLFTEKMIAEIKPIAIAAMGADKFAQMKEAIAQKVVDNMPNIIDRSYQYTTEALDIETEMRTKMQGITSAEFEGVLHPAFQEDEMTLILLGGVLGGLVGVLQLFTLFAN